LQNWVKDRQKRKMVGLLTDKDVKMFWEVQKILEEAVKENTNVKAFLYMKPMSTWSEYSNDTSYKGPYQILRWWSIGDYCCKREDAEHKSWDKLDADDTKEEFWAMLTSLKASSDELLDATVKCWNLGNKFDISFRNRANEKDEITVHFAKKPEQQ
jgi:hypothetical protein